MIRIARLSRVLACVAVGCLTAFAHAAEPAAQGAVRAWSVDPLVKVFRDAAATDQREASADAARGEHATFQVVVRSDAPVARLRCEVAPFVDSDATIGDAVVRFVGYVPVHKSYKTPAKDRVRKPPADFPDPLFEETTVDVKAGDAQAIWVTVRVPLDARPGTYRGVAKVRSDDAGVHADIPLTLNVYAAKVEKTRLWVTNWFQRDRGYDPMPAYYSPEFWEMLRLYARDMAAHRQNVARTVPLELAQYTFDADGKMTIDWSQMDRWVQIFIDEGVIGRIEGQQFGWWSTDPGTRWHYELSTYVVKDGKTVEVKVPPSSPEADRFYSQFLPSLQQHVIDKGWLDIWMQHVADEPDGRNAETYRQAADLVNKYAPRLRRMDALLSSALADRTEVMVPKLDLLARDYAMYQKRQADGQELWFYTCVEPQGEYANRFHELPLMKVRLLPWINYRYGATGFLHWGYNFWNKDAEYAKLIAGTYGTGRPDVLPGDGWVVYPKRNGLGVIDSIRWEAQRDGCEDHELLSQLAERDPAAARRLVERHVIDFNKYETDIATFRQTRRELLQLLSR